MTSTSALTATITDPWSGVTTTRPIPTVTPAEFRSANSETCGCGYDLCGTCMREAHQGLRPPLQHMPSPGRTEPDAWDLFHRERMETLRNG